MKRLLVSLTTFLILSCNFPGNKEPPISNEKLDTVQTAPPKIEANPVLFENAFIKGRREKVNDSTLFMYAVTIGKIKIPTGYIIACDPYLTEEYGKPFTQLFPTGEFPVQVSIAKLNKEETIAFARIKFSDEPVAKWEFALLKDEKPVPLNAEKRGYVVDSGIGSFMDEVAKKELEKDTTEILQQGLFKDMNKHYHHTWRYTIFKINNQDIAAYSTGFGDGNYKTYIGFDATGKPCRLLSDFGIFELQRK